MARLRVLTCVGMGIALAAGACQGKEFRAAWESAWSKGFFTGEQVNATVAAAKKANLTALFIQVRKNADAYYTPGVEPKGSEIAADFDPLADVIKKAQAEGIEVHAWINSCRVWASKQMPTDPTRLVNAHPDWLNKDYDGNTRASEGLYLDPGIPAAREYIASIFEDIAKRYDVDGVHLDYIRYPGKRWGYSEGALARYYAEVGTSAKPEPGDPKWLDWKRDQVTALVKLIRERVKAVKPDIKITASTIPWGDCPDDFAKSSPYATVCQDWRKWAADGLIDANMPMNYKEEGSTRAAREFRNWLDGFKRWSGGRPVYVGLEVFLNRPEQILTQIEAVRKAGLDGFVLFSFNQSKRREELVAALAPASCAASPSSAQ